MKIPKVAIMMFVKNDLKYFKLSVESILGSVKYPYKLFIIDNESTDGSAEYADSISKIYKRADGSTIETEIHHVKIDGALKCLNYGLKVTDPYDVYVTHTDTIHNPLYGKCWLNEMVQASVQERAGAVTSLKGFGVSGPDYIEGLNWLGTWSLYLPRTTIDKIGVFDEAYHPGNGDDIDYTMRIYRAKMDFYVIDYFVDHHRMTDHGNDRSIGTEEEIEKLKKRNALYFRKKFKVGEFAEKKEKWMRSKVQEEAII